MSNPVLSAQGLSFAFPGHPPIFANVSLQLNAGHYALLGHNGAGKSLLMSVLAGVRMPLMGTVEHHKAVCWQPQLAADVPSGMTVAQYLEIDKVVAALERLDAGQGSAEDVETVGEQWLLRESLTKRFVEFSLPPDCLQRDLMTLSGGQRSRLALLRLAPSANAFLLLDEPSNHLDQDSRLWLRDWLFAHPGGSLCITHDQDLLRQYQQIFELRGGSLFSYGGGLADYESQRANEIASAQAELKHARLTMRKERDQCQQEKERQERRSGQGSARAAKGGMPRILLGAMKARSESTTGKIQGKHQDALLHEQERARNAAARLEKIDPLHFSLTKPSIRSGTVAQLDGVLLPYVQNKAIRMHIRAGQRWRIYGPNGSGKSLLLRVLAGKLKPVAGQCNLKGHIALLDQHLSMLDNERSALVNFQFLNPGWTEQAYRDKLAQIRLRRERALLPMASLSGGERLKVALAILTMGPQAADLLLLDEPDNHLDLESQNLLADTLLAFAGTIVMVTHSDALAEAIGFDEVSSLDRAEVSR
tara:strand:- start:7239 stop:8837 length:1599 start_codon:yes stop_codon:yes gene_type:complete